MMEKKKHFVIAVAFYVLGTLAALYFGVFLMFLKPVYLLWLGFIQHKLHAGFVLHMLVHIALSSTMFGFIWCIGYVFFNHFMGTEDPDWESLNPAPGESEDAIAESIHNSVSNSISQMNE